ncbi:MAG TPA: recombinase family protein [Verrucomicrobiae bacterium]|nr:recombinase family protein [Verrucomicrobiae bacterium]
MKVAIYTRVSTDKQTHDSQLNELRDYCQRRGWANVTEYADVISGAKFSRQGLDRLMADVRRGKLDIVVCFKLDRLGRSLAHLAQIVGELTNHRVALVCPSQGIDTSTGNPASQLQLNILMAIAEFERSIIRERVTAGLRAAKANGTKLGRPKTISRHADAVRELLAKGKGVRAIARLLGLPVSSVHSLVREGSMRGNWRSSYEDI